MPRFFVEPPAGDTAILTGEDARHIIKSLRMREGETLTLCDGRGFDYQCLIQSAEGDIVAARVLARQPSAGEPAVSIRLYQALPKGDKLDVIVQKAVELGVREIVPVLTERCVSRPDERSMEKKSVRLQKIALEAAKQAGRGVVPRILPLQSYREAISGMKEAERAILLYEGAQTPLSACLPVCPAGSIAFMVGSEGGFSPEEVRRAESQGIFPASLGRRILRCETAPLCALSVILFAAGEF